MPRTDAAADRPLLAVLKRFLAACAVDDDEGVRELLFQMRRHLLFHGVEDDDGDTRALIWKTLLGVDRVSADRYCALIRLGPCEQYQKIRSDSFRTFPNEKAFQERVSENSMIRLLNSFVHENAADGFRYLQGMNAISAPFLFCMGELDAHATFSRFVRVYCPTYWEQAMLGPRAGCVLLDRCLGTIDRELYAHLKAKNLIATVYAFPLVSSMLCCLQPFTEVLKLWDFLIAFGLHLNVLTVIAQMVLVRDELVCHPSPNEILNYRKWPALNAKLTIAMTLDLVQRVGHDLMALIEQHTYSREACERVQKEQHQQQAERQL